MPRRRVVTRREVLTLSASLFAANGYRSTSLELVSERLGVTRQALYYHFKSKSAILSALFDEVMTKLESAIEAVPDTPLVDDAPRFIAMLNAYLDVTLANADLVVVLLNERPELNKIVGLNAGRRRRDFAETLIEAYSEGLRLGLLRDLDPWVTVNAASAMINSVPTWHHGPRVARLDVLKGIVRTMLTAGIVVPTDLPVTLPPDGGDRTVARF